MNTSQLFLLCIVIGGILLNTDMRYSIMVPCCVYLIVFRLQQSRERSCIHNCVNELNARSS